MRSPPVHTTSRASTCSCATRVPNRTSTSCSAYQPTGRTRASSRPCSPRRSSFESGGRSYGGSSSAPIRVIRPSNPSSRRTVTAVAPASPAPTTATDPGAAPSGTDLDLPVHLSDLERLERLGCRRVVHLARADVKHAPVALALDVELAVELAAGGQVAMTVRADVAEGVEPALGARDGDLGAAHVEGLHLALRHLARLAHRHELRHRTLLTVVGTVPAYGTCGEVPTGWRPERKNRTAHAPASAR